MHLSPGEWINKPWCAVLCDRILLGKKKEQTTGAPPPVGESQMFYVKPDSKAAQKDAASLVIRGMQNQTTTRYSHTCQNGQIKKNNHTKC